MGINVLKYSIFSDWFKYKTERINLDCHVIIEVSKCFAKHVVFPKEDFTIYEPPKLIESSLLKLF
jgi:hypothetical protein